MFHRRPRNRQHPRQRGVTGEPSLPRGRRVLPGLVRTDPALQSTDARFTGMEGRRPPIGLNRPEPHHRQLLAVAEPAFAVDQSSIHAAPLVLRCRCAPAALLGGSPDRRRRGPEAGRGVAARAP